MCMIIINLCDVPIIGCVNIIEFALKTILVFFVKVSQFYVLAPSAMVFCRDMGNTLLCWSFPFYMFSLGKFLAAKRIFWLICVWDCDSTRILEEWRVVCWGVTWVSSHAKLTVFRRLLCQQVCHMGHMIIYFLNSSDRALLCIHLIQ